MSNDLEIPKKPKDRAILLAEAITRHVRSVHLTLGHRADVRIGGPSRVPANAEARVKASEENLAEALRAFVAKPPPRCSSNGCDNERGDSEGPQRWRALCTECRKTFQKMFDDG